MDMTGAAAVLATVAGARPARASVNVLAVIPATENMTGGTRDQARRHRHPATARRSRSQHRRRGPADPRRRARLCGRARRRPHRRPRHPDRRLLVALGSTYAALISNDDVFAEQVEGAAERTGELARRLPLHARVQGPHQGHRRRPDQSPRQAQGRDDLCRLVPGGVRGRQALGAISTSPGPPGTSGASTSARDLRATAYGCRWTLARSLSAGVGSSEQLRGHRGSRRE